MILMLDTDLLIFMVRGLKSGRNQSLTQRAHSLLKRCRHAQITGNSVGLSSITVSELEYGARNSNSYDVEIAAVRKVLAPFEVYGFDPVECPAHYGRIRHELEAGGQSIGSMDLLIAAHALALDATLVTNNLAHFTRVNGLRTANWLKRA